MVLLDAGKNPSTFEVICNNISRWLDAAYGSTVVWILSALLLGVGLGYTIITHAMQIRLFPHMLKVVLNSRKGAKDGISSFQAFAIGIAARVGTGSITGVALAVVAGGPGSVFWMWVVAALGMATAFIESTLAQLFKVRTGDGTFRGGPSFYIMRGLGSRKWGVVFSVLLIFTYAFAFEMVQANNISTLAKASFNFPVWASAIVLVLLLAPLLLGGMRRIARFSAWLAPLMSVVYILMGIMVLVLNWREIPTMFYEIIASAFGGGSYVNPAVAGAGGYFVATLTNGIKRGLYTNEAGMGSAPNAAANATVAHPVTQGMVQSMAVFVDTMMICTTTAFIILLSQPYWDPNRDEELKGAALTSASLVHTLGSGQVTETIVAILIMIMMIAFGYTTLLGNYAYAESNWAFIFGTHSSNTVLRVIAICSTAIGAILPLVVVWSISDWSFTLMAVVNLGAVLLLGKWAVGALKDYEAQRKQGIESPEFCSVDNPHLPGELPTEVWQVPGGWDESWAEAKRA